MSMYIGEALAGDGNEVAHIDLLLGDKEGPVGNAFANALARQSEGHNNLLAVLTPNLAVKPATVMITKVTIKGMRQAVQMFGPAQAAVAKAIADSVADGVIAKDQAEQLVCVCGVFITGKPKTTRRSTTTTTRRPRWRSRTRWKASRRPTRCWPAKKRLPIRSADSREGLKKNFRICSAPSPDRLPCGARGLRRSCF